MVLLNFHFLSYTFLNKAFVDNLCLANADYSAILFSVDATRLLLNNWSPVTLGSMQWIGQVITCLQFYFYLKVFIYCTVMKPDCKEVQCLKPSACLMSTKMKLGLRSVCQLFKRKVFIQPNVYVCSVLSFYLAFIPLKNVYIDLCSEYLHQSQL